MRSNRDIFWFWKTIVLGHVNEFFKESFRSIPRTRFTWWSQQLTPWCFKTFAVQLYCQNKMPCAVTNLPELRWYMFSKMQTESASLPTTRETLRQKVLRSHHTTVVWKKSHIPHQDLPDPEDYGWKWSSSPSWYEAVTILLPPAPESIIHLTMCGCNAGCKTQRCKCKKNGLKCPEMCKCTDSENLKHVDL